MRGLSLREEGGYSLIELLLTLVLGLVVLLAAAAALQTFTKTSTEVEDRTVNAQTTRLAMDVVMRSLRSQACPAPGASSVLAGDTQTLQYVADLGDGTTAPEKRTLRFDPVTARLTEERFAGTFTDATKQTTTFAAVSGGVKQLLDRVGPAGTDPVFAYFAYDTSVPPKAVQQLTVPLSAADLKRVARVRVRIKRGGVAGNRNPKTAITLDDEVTLRSVDPSDPVPLPQCP